MVVTTALLGVAFALGVPATIIIGAPWAVK
jgi:hypothetical protein